MESTEKEVINEYTLSKERIEHEQFMPLLNKYFKDIPFGTQSTFMTSPMIGGQKQLDE